MKDFLSFKTMITPIVVQVAFWLGVVACVIAALVNLFTNLGNGIFSWLVMTIIILVLGPIVVRVYCELLIILFRIYEALKK